MGMTPTERQEWDDKMRRQRRKMLAAGYSREVDRIRVEHDKITKALEWERAQIPGGRTSPRYQAFEQLIARWKYSKPQKTLMVGQLTDARNRMDMAIGDYARIGGQSNLKSSMWRLFDRLTEVWKQVANFKEKLKEK